MVGEALGFLGEGLLFGGDGERGEGLGGLLGALVDQAGAVGLALAQEGKLLDGGTVEEEHDQQDHERKRRNDDKQPSQLLHSHS